MAFFKKMVVYFFGTIINKLCIFILLPIYTNHSTTLEYAQNDLAVSTVTMLVAFVFMEMQTSILRFYAENKEKGDRCFANSYYLLLFLTPIYVLTCWYFAKRFSLPNFELMILYGISYQVLYNAQMRIRAEKKAVLFISSGIFSSVIQLFLGVFFIVFKNKGIEMMFISPIVGNIAATIVLFSQGKLFSIIKREHVSLQCIGNILTFSVPLGINGLITWGMTTFNRYIVQDKLSAEQNAYIGVANKFSSLINLFILVFSLAWQEEAFDNADKVERNKKYAEMYNKFLPFIAFMAGGAILATITFFPYIFDERYLSTLAIIPIYYLASYVNAMNHFFLHIFTAIKKNYCLLLSMATGIVVNIVILLLLIDKAKLIAVPISLLFGYVVSYVIKRLLIKNFVEIRVTMFTIIGTVIMLATAFFVSNLHFTTKVNGIVLAIYSFLGILFFAIRWKIFDYIVKFTKKNGG